MATRVSVHSVPQPMRGKPAVRVHKVQLINDRGDRRAEARWLEAVDHTGIVRFHSTIDEPLTIVTDHAGSATLRTAGLTPAEASEVLASVALVLADLHDASMAHGKLTLDHIILGPNGPVLCSPDGRNADPAVDLASLALCIRDLERSWANGSDPMPGLHAWRALVDRLTGDPSMSARRAARLFRALGDPPQQATTPKPKALKSRRGLTTLGIVVTAAIGGLFVPNTDTAEAHRGVRVSVDDAEFEIGQVGDDVIVLDLPCDPAGRVLLLRDGVVWVFPTASDGQRAAPFASVPGATSLIMVDLTPAEFSPGDSANNRPNCQAAHAAGPAGASLLRTWELAEVGGKPGDSSTIGSDG